MRLSRQLSHSNDDMEDGVTEKMESSSELHHNTFFHFKIKSRPELIKKRVKKLGHFFQLPVFP